MQHGGSPTKRKEKPHTHTAATWTAAAHNAAAGAEQRRRWTPESNGRRPGVVVVAVSRRSRATAPQLHNSDDGGVER